MGCIVFHKGKYLMVRENPSGSVVWNLPAGHVDKDEGLEAAAVRETKEETGYDVRLIEQVGLYHESAPQSVKHVYLAEIIGGELKAQQGEILSVEWADFSVIKHLQETGELRAPWVWEAIRKHHSNLS